MFLFYEVNKIYIKKCKFSFLNKITYSMISLVLLSISVNYLPVDSVLLASVILFIVLIAKMNTHKWHHLVLHLNDGTSCSKVFYSSAKQSHINLVNVVRKEYNNYRVKSNFKVDTPKKVKGRT